ncbi:MULTISPECIES: heat-inducible transcriptional repressor HrcA [Anaerolinea]|uniref:heat-inducible transcriptional repressor HrcA n=1 Tax=Anaerolinea TaxID=233189 RepID=UPI00261D05B9|nr:heat-inducible transcriptional repressor HrcA [Anaerolinea thermophila]
MNREPTERQKFLLALVVHEYVRTAMPVSSLTLVEQYKLDMSSATVRNELAALTEMGYLRQPHTSAGRVPTEEGYRFFVGRLMQETALPDSMRHTITHQFYQMGTDVEQWMRLAASVLAHQSRAASLVTAPHPERARLKHLELISTRGRQVLMVLVIVGGEIRQRILTLSEPVPQEKLSEVADRISRQLQDRDADSIRALRSHFDGLAYDILGYVIDDLYKTERTISGEIFTDGLTNVLAEPEFSNSEEARRALRLLEERTLLQELLARTVFATNAVGGVQVLIGGEGTWEDLRQSSLLLTRYGVPGQATGTLGVLGPMRMAYGRTISTLRFLAGLLSDLVAETLVEDEHHTN